MDVLEYLRSLCDKYSSRHCKPFSLTLRDQRFIGATNGHAMTIVRSDSNPEIEAAPFDVGLIIPNDGMCAQLNAEALVNWSREGCAAGVVCPDCKGEKYRECFDRCFNTSSEQKHRQHFVRCSSCDGAGASKDHCRPGRMGGLLFDRAILLKFIPASSTGEVAALIHRIAGSGGLHSGVLHLAAPDWQVVVMGMTGDKTSEAGAPVFAGWPAAEVANG